MKGKIFSLFIVFLMFFASFNIFGILIKNNFNSSQNKSLYDKNTFKKDDYNSNIKNKVKNKLINNKSRGYALGLLPGEPPGLKTPPSITLSGDHPPVWDWRKATYENKTGDWTTPIRDQGNCGSCYAFAAVAALEALYNIKNNDPDIDIDLSEQFIISCGMEYNPFSLYGCCGAFFISPLDYLQHEGTIEEECLPYYGVDSFGRDADDCGSVKPSHDPVKCSDKCSNWSEQVIKIGAYYSLWDGNSIKNAIYKYGPVIAQLNIYEDFIYYRGGIYEHETGRYLGGHMVAVVGYDDENRCWICKNSWGKSWGETIDGKPNKGSDGGWFRVKYGDVSIPFPMIFFINYTTNKKSYETPDLNFLDHFSLVAWLLRIYNYNKIRT